MTKAELTKAQLRRLTEIAAYMPSRALPYPGFWDTRTDRALLQYGLIEQIDHVRGDYPVRFTLNCCRLTPAGRVLIAEASHDKG